MILKKLTVGELQTNCYILASQGGAVVIDPGAEAERILAFLKLKNLKLKFIILTHGHPDHLLGSYELSKATSAKVAVHPQELNHQAELKLDEGTVLEVGRLKLKILHTPGHTPGSISVLVGDRLFSGDLLFKGSVGRTDLPGGSYETLLASLKKICKLPNSTKIYPGHGEETTLAEEKKFNPFLQSMLTR